MKVVITEGFLLSFRSLYRSGVSIMELLEGHGGVAAGD